MVNYNLYGGAVVSGPFQAFDQSYLIDTLKKLGRNFFGVTHLPVTATDDDIINLHQAGMRAVRFNLKRGDSEEVAQLALTAKRVYELAGWHIELYVDSSELENLYSTLITFPSVILITWA